MGVKYVKFGPLLCSKAKIVLANHTCDFEKKKSFEVKIYLK